MAYISQQDKKDLAPAIKAVLKNYGMKGTIAINHYSSLVVNIQSGVLDFSGHFSHGDGYSQVNTYWIHEHYKGVAKDFLTELLAEMKGKNYYNNDNAQFDHFDRSHYTDINIGKWNKPYKKVSKIYEFIA